MTRSDDRAARLRAYIERSGGEPEIGFSDCGPWVVSWIEIETDRRLEFPPYRTREEARALCARAGGLVALISPAIVRAGLFQTDAPQLGDVCVLQMSARETAGIICRGGIAAIRGEKRGVLFLNSRRRISKAWALPNGH